MSRNQPFRTTPQVKKNLQRALLAARSAALTGDKKAEFTLSILEGRRGAKLLLQSVSKLDAAQRQMDCAIRLFFENEEPLAIHAISRGGIQIVI